MAAAPTDATGARPALRAALALALLALGVRLVAWFELRGSVWDEVLLGDASHFAAWGARIAAGDWLGREVFYQAPLYPYLLALLERLCGPGHAPAQLLQVVVAALAVGILAHACWNAFSPRVGVLAGVLLALCGPCVWYDLQLEKTSLAVSLSALLAAGMLHGAQRPWRALGLGAGLGLLVLLRENALVLGLPLALASAAGGAGRARRLAAFALGLGAVLGPVAARNLVVGGAFLPTASNAGVNFYIGNGLDADGLYRPLVAGRGHPDFEREDATRLAQELSGRTLAAHEVSAFWFARAWSELRADPGHALALLAHKARLVCARNEIMDAVAFEVYQDESTVLTLLGWLSFALLLPLAAAGAALVWHEPAVRRLALAVGLLALSIVLFFVVARFRLPLVPFLVPLAAVALGQLRTLVRTPAAVVALLVLGPVCATRAPVPGDPRAASHANLASEFLRRRDHARAERAAARARELDPGSPEAAYNQGVALRALGREREALEPFEAAARLEPAYAADALAEIGAILAVSGDREGARAKLDEALRLAPGHEAATRYRAALDAR